MADGDAGLLPCPACGGPAGVEEVRYKDVGGEIFFKSPGGEVQMFRVAHTCGGRRQALGLYQSPEEAADDWNGYAGRTTDDADL